VDLRPRGAGSWVFSELGRILLRTPKSVIDGGGAQHIRWEQSSSIRLVFWVEVRPEAGYVVSSGGPGPEGRRLMGYSELGQIPLRTLTV